MGRFELLRKLHEAGVNDFAVYWARDDPKPARWPVFVRSEADHGLMSKLLDNQQELEHVLEHARRDGTLDGKMVVEFCDTADESGLINKYGAFRVGDRILARQIHFSRRWAIRVPDLKQPELMRRELDYVRTNPDADVLLKIFELAKIDYGRLDYSKKNGRIQVWEINTNPMILIPADRRDPLRCEAHDTFGQAFNRALLELMEQNSKASA